MKEKNDIELSPFEKMVDFPQGAADPSLPGAMEDVAELARQRDYYLLRHARRDRYQGEVTDEEMAIHEESNLDDEIENLQYSDQGKQIIMDSLAEKGREIIEERSPKDEEDTYTSMWAEHRKKTRGTEA